MPSDKSIRTRSSSARGNTSEDTRFRSDTPHTLGDQPKQAWVEKQVGLSNSVIIRHKVILELPRFGGRFVLGLS
jgi:hypothetical protein